MSSKTISFDFDGVIHHYTSGWTGVEPTDPPTPGIRDLLVHAKNLGYRLVILSTRPDSTIWPWLKRHGLDAYFASVSSNKEAAWLYIDDRGYRFNGAPSMRELFALLTGGKEAMEPWNRK